MQQYFDDPSELESDPMTVSVTLADTAFEYTTDRGVFSHGHLDEGTALLLQDAPAPATEGHLLDLGCGAGPIAIAMALRSRTATVWAVDVNPRAITLTRGNAERAGVSIRVDAPDAIPPDIRFDTIWSNPPIRIGKDALRKMLTTWLARLAPEGTAVLVVNRHLGADSLHRWLESQGWVVRRLTSRRGFRLLEVRPAPSSDRVDGDPDPATGDTHS